MKRNNKAIVKIIYKKNLRICIVSCYIDLTIQTIYDFAESSNSRHTPTWRTLSIN